MIKQYIGLIRRWLWLLLLASSMTSVLAYLIVREQPISYEASARLIVGPGIDGINPDLNDLRTGGQLMQTYAELVTTRPVLQSAIDAMSLSITPDRLENQIEVRTDDTTQILRIRVEDLDPERAITIVNTLVNMVVQMSPSGVDESVYQIKARMAAHIAMLEEDAANSETAMLDLQAKLQTATTAETRRLLEAQLIQERNYLADARRTLASFYTNFQDSYTNQVKIIELAAVADPIDANLYLTVLMAGLAGLILTMVIVVGFEYLNDKISTTEELAHIADVPLLGTIPKHKLLSGASRKRFTEQAFPELLIPDALRPIYESRQQFVVEALPNSHTTENYRMLASKLLLSRYRARQMDYRELADKESTPVVALPTSSVKYPLGSVVVSGAHTDEDTSDITANLAVTLAQTGHRVILVDANLHRPTIGQKFGIGDSEGLTSVLRGRSKHAELIPIHWAPNLFVLPSGAVPPNPFELLVSNRMANLIQELESQADIVLITASPLLSFADSLILASRADGVLVVVHNGKANRETVREVISSLRSLDAEIIGAIFDNSHVSRPFFFPKQRQTQSTAPEALSKTANPVTGLLESTKS